MKCERRNKWWVSSMLGLCGAVSLIGLDSHGRPVRSNGYPLTRQDVLQAMVRKPGVLINIRRSLFPATSDITLLGQRATRALRQGLLGNTSAAVRWRAAQVLTQLRDTTARPELHLALKDWNASVRHQVLSALSYIGDGSSVPLVIKRLKDPHETVSNQVAALRALGKIGDGRAAPVIIASYNKAGNLPAMRLAAVSALWDLRRKFNCSCNSWQKTLNPVSPVSVIC